MTVSTQTFRPKRTVRAWQISKMAKTDNALWPDWVARIVTTGPDLDGEWSTNHETWVYTNTDKHVRSCWLTKYRSFSMDPYSVKTTIRHILDGDWIVYGDDGKLECLSHELFQQEYE